MGSKASLIQRSAPSRRRPRRLLRTGWRVSKDAPPQLQSISSTLVWWGRRCRPPVLYLKKQEEQARSSLPPSRGVIARRPGRGPSRHCRNRHRRRGHCGGMGQPARVKCPAPPVIGPAGDADAGRPRTAHGRGPKCATKAPFRPSGGREPAPDAIRGKGPRSGKVRWAEPLIGASAPLILPSPPGRREERVRKLGLGASQDSSC
jgi:hypothetical protein